MSKFKLGFMVGRMQPIHKGHQQLIDLGLELCDRFIILLGSSNSSRTKSNPFTFEERKHFIEKIYENKVEVYPIMDIGIGYIPEWGNYLMNTIKFYCGEYPDFVINGSEKERFNWINKENYPELSELTISRNLIKISSSEIRNEILKYQYYEEVPFKVEQMLDKKLTRKAEYNKIRKIIRSCK